MITQASMTLNTSAKWDKWEAARQGKVANAYYSCPHPRRPHIEVQLEIPLSRLCERAVRVLFVFESNISFIYVFTLQGK